MKIALALVLTALVAALGAATFGAGSAQASSCWYSPRGCVHVRGYYKPSTGTYVSPYFRNYPGYRSYYSYTPRYSSYYGYRSYYSYTPRYSSYYGW
jgi:hypothetical protein